MMRIPALVVLAIGAVQIAAPARAQTYDPSYPICLAIYEGIAQVTYECRYTSMAQCAASASGRSASCVVNPYPAKTYAKPGRRQTRPPTP